MDGQCYGTRVGLRRRDVERWGVVRIWVCERCRAWTRVPLEEFDAIAWDDTWPGSS